MINYYYFKAKRRIIKSIPKVLNLGCETYFWSFKDEPAKYPVKMIRIPKTKYLPEEGLSTHG